MKSKFIERPDGYWRYQGNTVDIEWDPSRPEGWWYCRRGNMEYGPEFPEGREVQDNDDREQADQ